jgi:hypothetical protein
VRPTGVVWAGEGVELGMQARRVGAGSCLASHARGSTGTVRPSPGSGSGSAFARRRELGALLRALATRRA